MLRGRKPKLVQEGKIMKDLSQIKNRCLRSIEIGKQCDFDTFHKAIGNSKGLGRAHRLYDIFLYYPNDAVTVSEHFDIFSRKFLYDDF